MRFSTIFFNRIALVLALSFADSFVGSFARADVELPMGGLTGCPFIHDDSYDLSPLLSTLKAQIGAKMNNESECSKAAQAMLDSVTPLHDFYKTIDPTVQAKISQSVYVNLANSLNTLKLELEGTAGGTATPEYATLLGQLSILEANTVSNNITLQSAQTIANQNTEAYYRNQLAAYTSNLMSTYTSTLRSSPQCIGSSGGWIQALSSVLSGVSVAAGLGINPMAQGIGAAINAVGQLINLLKDTKIRSAYNGLVKLKNYKTLACTYYSIKNAKCEYQRTYKVSLQTAKLRAFLRNQFTADIQGQYERYSVNQGRISQIGSIFTLIAHMGSPLTLDLDLLGAYMGAKAVDFESLGTTPPPADNAPDAVIGTWLIRARAFGIEFRTRNEFGIPQSLQLQLASAKTDMATKLATIIAAEELMRKNLSFIDLKRRSTSDFPNIKTAIEGMKDYLTEMHADKLVLDTEKETIKASISLLTFLSDFLKVADLTLPENAAYEKEVVAKGGQLFLELAKGSVAQLTKQSVLALAEKGTDRLGWSFGVIRNAYLNRDQTENRLANDRFGEYLKNYNVLADVISNYNLFSGAGTTFRDEDFVKSVSSFEDAFKKEMLDSLELAIGKKESNASIPELAGQTAAHLCALYSPTLEKFSENKVLGGRAARILSQCHTRFKTLQFNHLVSDKDFTIDYNNECTYLTYSREIGIQDLLAKLIKP